MKNWAVLELWLKWLVKYISIDDQNAEASGYLEEIMPGWVCLQLSRVLAPHSSDLWVCPYTKQRKFTSYAFVRALRCESQAGYLIDELSWERWLAIKDYTDNAWKPFPHPQGDELTDEQKAKAEGTTYQILRLSQIQPGINSNVHWWIPLDLNKMCYFF